MNNNTLTLKWLYDNDACKEGIQFAIKNKLIGFPFELLPEIKGDYNNFISWININSKNILTYDDNGYIIRCIKETGFDYRYQYDDKYRLINKTYNHNGRYVEYRYDHLDRVVEDYDSSSQYFSYYTYDDNNNLIFKNISHSGYEHYYYDLNNNLIKTTYAHGFSSECQYDEYNNKIYQREINDFQTWYEYDAINVIHTRNSYNLHIDYVVEYYPDGQLKSINELLIPYFDKDLNEHTN